VGRRDDPKARKVQRALDDLDRGLRRGDIDRAVAALGELPAELRATHAPPLRERFGAEVADAHRRRDWVRLAALGRGADGAPELLTGDAGGAAWALMWGCGRQNDLARARRMFARIEAETAAQAPSLARAVSAWLGGGDEPAAALDALPTLAMAQATRPGAGLPRAPATLAEVLPAVCALVTTQPWAVVEGTLGGRWTLDGELGAATRAAGFALAVREHLHRAAEGRAEAWAPLSLAARLAAAAPSRDEALELLRLTLPAAGRAPDGPPKDLLHAVIRLGAWDAALRPVVLSALATMAAQPEEWRASMALHRTVFEASKEVEAWVAAVVAYYRRPEADDDAEAEPWITDAIDPLVSDGVLVSWLLARSPERRDVLKATFELMLPEEFERLSDRLWDRADDELRTALAGWMSVLIEEAPSDVFDGFDLPMGPLLSGALKTAQRAMLRRQEQRMLPYSEGFLRLTLALPTSDADARDAVARFVARGGTILRRLTALRMLHEIGRMQQAGDLLREIVTVHAGDATALAEGMLWSTERGAPHSLVVELAAALRAAVGDGVPPRGGIVAEALLEADEFAPRPKTKKKPAAEKKTKKPAAEKKTKKPAAEKKTKKKKPAAGGGA
jgi:hypothetical protein